MTSTINISNSIQAKKQNTSFKANGSFLFQTLDKSIKPLDSFIKIQENLSSTRFLQDTTTNWVPKAAFTRSKADLAEMSFLEFLESGLFYFAPGLLGEFIFRRQVFSKFFPKESRKELDKHISNSLDQILLNNEIKKSGVVKKIIPIKAAIVLSCACIPAAEYALSFAKNLFTLKVFKKADFNNIANLEKNKKENIEHQDKVEKSAKKHIKKAGIISLAGLGSAITLAAVGHKSEKLQIISKTFLQPGAVIYNGLEKLGVKSKKLQNFLKTYINFDFDSSKGKLGLSKGQLAVTTISGFFGYNEAAKDRGRLDQLEVLTRVPLVVFYTIFGSSLFENGFKRILNKKNIFADLIKKSEDNILTVPSRKELPKLAAELAAKNKTKIEDEFKKLIKGKATITAVPFLFSLVFMGFTLAGISRFWTQFRYNKSKENEIIQDLSFREIFRTKKPKVFQNFQ